MRAHSVVVPSPALNAERRTGSVAHARCRRAGARGSGVSPGSLGQDQLVEGEIRDSFPQPLVLGLELLQALDLARLQAAELLAPAIVGHLRDADLADGLGHR